MRNLLWIGPGLAAGALVLAACGTNSAPTDPPTASPPASALVQTHTEASSVAIRTMSTSKGKVLVNAHGRTLYWFAKDTRSQSKCNASCTTYWPPVLGRPVAAAGAALPHGFGTIKRADGQTQATYDGHPLYTYAGDTSAGQVTGNGINVSGGLWWAVTPSGRDLGSKTAKAAKPGKPAPSPSSSSSSSGGGW
jgi:predicted lipoprotein with Yx(FWY)xxD motif